MLVAIPFGNGYFVNETGVKRANICKVLKGERRYAGGYEWGYAACGGELEVNNR